MNTDDLSNWLRTSGPSLANLHVHLLMPGETVGPWRICSFLGQGGTSEVYRVNRGDDVEAALKIARDPEMTDITARLKREGQLLRQLHSRHFATFFDEGVYGNRPYLVTELLQPLESPETDTAVAELALQLTDALGELHHLGYVHRDVKPANILTRDGHAPVLVDLGYAKPIDPSATPIPQRTPLSQTVCQFFGLGTPGYAAPEQLTGDMVSPPRTSMRSASRSTTASMGSPLPTGNPSSVAPPPPFPRSATPPPRASPRPSATAMHGVISDWGSASHWRPFLEHSPSAC